MSSERSTDALLEGLQEWYHSNCDGDWEHEYSVRITNLDNPGWAVSIPLAETSLEERSFSEVRWERSPGDWVYCRIDGTTFLGSGGSRNLADIVQTFLVWADSE